MENINWLKQTDGPLFEDMLWSRPQNRRQAGKLLIAGGHSENFSAVARAYAAAGKAGAGTVRVLLPLSLQKTLGRAFPEAEFADSTPIGSFSRQALGLFLELSDWADGVLLAGEFGRNSETAVLLENYVTKYPGRLSLAGDSLDYFGSDPKPIVDRPMTTIAGSLSQVQKLSKKVAIKQSADLVQILNMLSIWTSETEAGLITEHGGQIIVAHKGKISSTPASGREISEETGAYAGVWDLQQTGEPFKALTTSVWCFTRQ
jgi:hypothetical protein